MNKYAQISVGQKTLFNFITVEQFKEEAEAAVQKTSEELKKLFSDPLKEMANRYVKELLTRGRENPVSYSKAGLTYHPIKPVDQDTVKKSRS
jgi:hypothetical protein